MDSYAHTVDGGKTLTYLQACCVLVVSVNIIVVSIIHSVKPGTQLHFPICVQFQTAAAPTEHKTPYYSG